IYVLDDRGEMSGEYILDADCPIDYDDFLKVLPPEGIGDRDSLFVGEYVFTAFQSGKFVFVLLSRGHLASEDVDWTALLLTAADSHLAAKGGTPVRGSESKVDSDKGLADRESRLNTKEKALAEQEAKLKAELANLSGRQEELNRQKAGLASLADYAARMQDSVSRGVSRAMKTLEMTKQLASKQARERKFLQRRAIELLDREERVRDREAKSDEREHDLARRTDDLTTREQDVGRQKTILAQARAPAPDARAQTDEAKKDIERRVK